MLKDQQLRPIVFLANNIGDCLTKNNQEFFEKGVLAREYTRPYNVVNFHCEKLINSFH